MPDVLNFQTGQVERLEGADFSQAVLSGRYGVRDNETVAAITPTGDYQRIPATEAAEAFRHGWLHEPESAENRRKAEEKYGSTGQAALAGLAGAARGASLGLSDVALTKSGLVKPETLQGLQEANPTASTLGEVGGAAVGLLAPGGAVLKGAGAAAEGLGLARLGGEGLTAAIGRKAVGSAVEGALYGGGQLLTEDALGETPFSSEALLSHMGAGALLGGTAGAVFGAAPRAISVVSKEVGERLDNLLPGGTVREKIGNFLQDYADHGAVETAGATAKDYGRLRRMDISKREMAKEMFDSGIVSSDVGEIAEKSAAIKAETGEKIGATVRQLDDFAAANPEKVTFKDRLSTGALADKIQADVLEPLQKEVAAGNAPIISRVEKEIENLRNANGGQWDEQLPLEDGERIKRSYDKFLKLGAEPTPVQEALQKIRGIVKTSVEDEATRIAEKADPQLAKDFLADKRKYQVFSEINRMATAKMDRAANAPAFGMKDYGAGLHAVLGAAMYNPKGALLGLPAMALHKFAREQGPAFTANLANKAARLAKMERAVNAVKNEIEDNVASLLSAKKESLTSALKAPAAVFGGFSMAGRGRDSPTGLSDQIQPALPERKRQQFDEQMVRLGTDPEHFQQTVTQSLAHVEDVAPRNSLAMATTAAKIVGFMQSKAPRNPNPITGIKSLGAPAWEPNDTEVYKYARYAEAALHPMTVIKGLGDGSVSPEGVETLKTLYPAMYQQTVKTIMAQLSAKDAPALSYETRLRLSSLLGAPLDPMLSDTVVKALQAGYAPAQPALSPQWSPSQIAQSTINLSNGIQTPSQKLEKKYA